MANFLVISNNKVINCIVADNKEISELVTGLICIEKTDDIIANIGDIYNPETNTFSEPEIEQSI